MAMPVNPVALYWVYWNPFKRLVDFPTTYNMFFLFHAYPPEDEREYDAEGNLTNPGGETGRVSYRTPSGLPGTFLAQDIATCRARGQKIILSIGGAGGQVYLTDHPTDNPLNVSGAQARCDNFVQSIKDFNTSIGGTNPVPAFDGIDWNNFEGGGSSGAWMTYCGQQLQSYFGSDFLFTSPPAAFAGGQDVSDRLLLAEMYQGGVLDWLCPQYYDPSDLNTEAKIAYYSDFYHTAVTVNGSSVQIPRDHIGIGFACESVASSSRWSFTGAATAYTNAVNAGYAPKGAFNWANYTDTGDQFASIVAPVITNNTNPATPAFVLASSTNFTNGSATTAQLTAPSGKTTSDFQAGTINETSNPAASITLASGKYTEIEWCIQATSSAVNAQQYEFRITNNGVVLATYSQTPKWTIGTPAVAAKQVTSIGSMTGISSITL